MSSAFRKAAGVSRIGEWWSHKIPPILGFVYVSALLQDVPPATVAIFIPLLLLALIPGAVFVSVLNDLTDLRDDRKAGKRNRSSDLPYAVPLAVVLLCVMAGIAVAAFLDTASVVFYAAAWMSYAAYSVPPPRLKARGLAGVLADGLGANVFPVLFAVAFLDHFSGSESLSPFYFVLIGLWSLGWGARGILWHQLKDAEADKAAGVSTFVYSRGKAVAKKLARYLFFPIEIAAFALLLVYAGSPFLWIAAASYAGFEYARAMLWEIDVVVVDPSERHRLLLDDLYCFFLPVGALLALQTGSAPAIALLSAHLLVFWQRTASVVGFLADSARKGYLALREFLLGY